MYALAPFLEARRRCGESAREMLPAEPARQRPLQRPTSPTALLANDLVAHHLATHAPELLEVVATHGECPPMCTRVLDRSRLHAFIDAFKYEKVCNVLSPCANSLAGDESRQLTHLLKLLDDGALRVAIENKDFEAARRAFARLRSLYKNDAHPHMRNFALAISVGSVEHLTPMWKQPDQPSQDGSQGAVVGSTVTNENRLEVLHDVLDRVLDQVPELLEATQRYSTLPDLAEKLRELEQLVERATVHAEEARAAEVAARAAEVAARAAEEAAKEKLSAAEVTLAQRDRELASRDREIASRDREIASRDREIASRDLELADLRMQLELHAGSPAASASTAAVRAQGLPPQGLSPQGLSCTADDGPLSSSSEIAIWTSKRAHGDEGDQAVARRQRTEIASDRRAAGVGVRAPGEVLSTEARSTEARSTKAQSPMASSPADLARSVLPPPPPPPDENFPRLTATAWLCDESATPLQDASQPAVQVLFNVPTGDLLLLQRNARLVAFEKRSTEEGARRTGAVAGTFRWSGVLHEAALPQADSSSVSGASVLPHLHLIRTFDKRPSMSGFLSRADGILISQPWKPELADSRLHANALLHRLLAGRGPWGAGMAHSAQDQNLVALCAPRKVLIHNMLLLDTLEWYSVGDQRPAEGKEVENEAFGTALLAKLVAKEENWPTPAEAELFGVLLSADSFVRADGQFWRQRPCCQELFVGATSESEIPRCLFSLNGDFLLVATSSTLRAYAVLPEAKYDKAGLVVAAGESKREAVSRHRNEWVANAVRVRRNKNLIDRSAGTLTEVRFPRPGFGKVLPPLGLLATSLALGPATADSAPLYLLFRPRTLELWEHDSEMGVFRCRSELPVDHTIVQCCPVDAPRRAPGPIEQWLVACANGTLLLVRYVSGGSLHQAAMCQVRPFEPSGAPSLTSLAVCNDSSLADVAHDGASLAGAADEAAGGLAPFDVVVGWDDGRVGVYSWRGNGAHD